MLTYITRPNSLIDTIASNDGYRRKMPYVNLLTHSLSYPQSRDAIASKNININTFYLVCELASLFIRLYSTGLYTAIYLKQ